MGAVPPPLATDPHRPRNGLLSLIALLLAVSFITVGAIQWRHYKDLFDKVHDSRDNQQYLVVQFVAEYQNLRQELLEIKVSHNFRDIAAASHRYEIFLSRVPLITPEMMADLLEPTPQHRELMARLQRFTTLADPYLSAEPTQVLTEAKLDELRALFVSMREPVHDLATAGFHRRGLLTQARNRVVVEQNFTRLILTGYLFGLTLLFAMLALRQYRRSEAQRVALHQQAGQLRDALHLAEAGSRAKDGFMATMSHELRTPFNGLLGMLELVQDDPLSARQRDHIATAQASGQHLLGLLNDMLDSAKLEAGGLQPHLEPFDLGALVHEVASLTAIDAKAHGVRFHPATTAEAPPWVRGDSFRIRQILLNLLTNAVKFSPQGDVWLRVRSAAAGDEGSLSAGPPRVEFIVTDTGIGMDADAVERLFKRFSQADSSISRRFGGTGLGLEISRNLARLMGGDITVQSQPGRGSVFTLTLPLLACDAPATSPTRHTTKAARAGATAADSLRVLVAEDHPVNRRLMQSHLEQLGCTPDMVEDGQQALAAVQDQVPDLILMDLHMPHLNGFEATRAIRRLPGAAGQVCIVALTADAQSEVRDQALAAGMNHFLTKPVRRADLREMLQRHVATVAASAVPAAGTHDDAATVHATPAPPAQPAPSSIGALPALHNGTDLDLLLDRALIDEMLEDFSPAAFSQMLARLLSDHSGSCAAVASTLRSGDFGEIKSQAHSLKGATASFGLRGVAAVALQLEQAGAALSPQDAPALLAKLQHQWALSLRICQELKLLDTPPAPAPAAAATAALDASLTESARDAATVERVD